MWMEPGSAVPVPPMPEPVFVPVRDAREAAGQQPAKEQPQTGRSSGFAFSDPEAEPPSYSRYAVLNMEDYLGMMLLMLIPGVNIILLLIWALGGSKKINRQNYARAALVMLLISAVLTVVAGFIMGEMFTRVWAQFVGFF
jgi:hypothetical protein